MKISKILVVRVLKFIGKYILPAVCGYLEGSSQVISDALRILVID